MSEFNNVLPNTLPLQKCSDYPDFFLAMNDILCLFGLPSSKNYPIKKKHKVILDESWLDFVFCDQMDESDKDGYA